LFPSKFLQRCHSFHHPSLEPAGESSVPFVLQQPRARLRGTSPPRTAEPPSFIGGGYHEPVGDYHPAAAAAPCQAASQAPNPPLLQTRTGRPETPREYSSLRGSAAQESVPGKCEPADGAPTGGSRSPQECERRPKNGCVQARTRCKVRNPTLEVDTDGPCIRGQSGALEGRDARKSPRHPEALAVRRERTLREARRRF